MCGPLNPWIHFFTIGWNLHQGIHSTPHIPRPQIPQGNICHFLPEKYRTPFNDQLSSDALQFDRSGRLQQTRCTLCSCKMMILFHQKIWIKPRNCSQRHVGKEMWRKQGARGHRFTRWLVSGLPLHLNLKTKKRELLMRVTLFPPMKTNLIHRWLISVDTRMQKPAADFGFINHKHVLFANFGLYCLQNFASEWKGPDHEEFGRNIQL